MYLPAFRHQRASYLTSKRQRHRALSVRVAVHDSKGVVRQQAAESSR